MIKTIEAPFIHEAKLASFKQLVLLNSNRGPVLVNFWSRKAEPCLRQYPILDKLVNRYNGRFLLINVNSDTEDQLRKKCDVKSLPTLQLYRRESCVESIQGYQGETELETLLDRYVSRDCVDTVAKSIGPHAHSDEHCAVENIPSAQPAFPVNPALPLALCKLLIHEEQFTEAREWLNSLPANMRSHPDVKQLEHKLYILEIVAQIQPRDRTRKITRSTAGFRQEKCALYGASNHDREGLEELVKTMEIDAGCDGAFARKTMQKALGILGEDHPLTQSIRLKLRRHSH